jgi:glycosyltransferase involved in cell wall biosynthesis
VSTYPPRRCGIATFTQDLAVASGEHEIAVLHDANTRLAYPQDVHHWIRDEVRNEYERTATILRDCADVVSIQHEYGIWGGTDGEYVLDFLRALQVPSVATLHTVLQHPTSGQRAVLSELVARTDATVVMSRSAARLLTTAYGVDSSRVEVIPHGVPDVRLVDDAAVKPGLGVVGRKVILSFGLLGPGKGYELVLDALPAVVESDPTALYVIVGATHPSLIRREGETYRVGLVEQVRRLGLDNNVRFVDRYVDRRELIRWLQATDIFVTPYPNLDQIVSGTLSYAMGAGRAIVSTPYAYAAELLADGRGMLTMPGSPVALANALVELLCDDGLRAAMGRRAYAYSRAMVWSSVGAEYRRVFADVLGNGSTTLDADALVPALA